MNKATKGALAAVAAGSLMLGGAGTLAYWSGARNVTGANINTGHLSLDAPSCTGTGKHDWEFNGQPYVAQVLVPGDTLVKVCDLTLHLAGDNIGANLAVTGGTLGAGEPELTKSVTFMEGLNPMPATVNGAGDHTYRATITVSLPSNATGTMDVSTALSSVTLTAEQTHA